MNTGAIEKENPRAGKATGASSEQGESITYPTAAQLRTAAEAYLYRGWHPIPIAPAEKGNPDTGKAPTLKGWQAHFTRLDEIKRFWPDGTRNNIGISCGPSRLVVLDFDEAPAYRAWKAKHPEAAKSYTVARDNAEPGRCHVYFTLGEEQVAPAQLTKKAVGWGDLKADGGQVVAPPSVHFTRGRYTVLIDADPLQWDAQYTPELWGAIDAGGFEWEDPLPRPSLPRTDAPGIPPSVQQVIDAGAEDGCRNSTAFAAACQLRDEGHAEGTARAILGAFAARCRPPLPQAELAATVKSAYAKPPRKPARNTAAPVYLRMSNGRIRHFDNETEAQAAEELIGVIPGSLERIHANDPRVSTPTAPEPAPAAWPDPEPLGDLDGTPPPWPWEVYPRTLRDLGQAICETMNVPAELPGLGLLCAASIACGKVAAVEIKHGHQQYGNLYGMAALPAATGKTPALRPIQAPLIARQIDMRSEHLKALRDWKGQWKVARARIAALEKAVQKGEGDRAEIAAEIARLEAVEDEKPPEPILIADNATSEALARILAGNGGTLGVFSADGRDILAIAGGKYSTGGSADVSVWLKAHAGDYLAYHRANFTDKPPFECVEPILAAMIAVQPDALKTLGSSVTLRESGFLARWLYVIPECGPGAYPEQSIMESITRRYSRTVACMLAMAPATDDDGRPIPYICRLDNSARAAWIAAHDALKREAHTAPPLLAQCMGKLPEHIARIALVFHLAECAERDIEPGMITEPEIDRAADLGAVLLAHIHRAVSYLGESVTRAKARELLPILYKHRDILLERRRAENLGDLLAVKPRDVVRGAWAGIQTTDDARAALDMLDVKGWVRLRTVEARRARDHEIYEMHPSATIA